MALGRIFSNDPDFLDLFAEARVPFTITLVLMNLSVAIERIPYSMGRTKEVFWLGFIASWGAQVPAVILLTKYWRDDLAALYWGMAIGYAVVTVLYGWISFTRYDHSKDDCKDVEGIIRLTCLSICSDWRKYAELARQRSEMSDD